MMAGLMIVMRMHHKLPANKENKRHVPVMEVLPVEAGRVLEAVEADPLLVYTVIFVVAVSKPIVVFNTQMAP